MKTRLLFTFFLSMMLTVCNAQSHLRFMGIPLTGSIATFQSKLLAKGCRLNKSGSANLPVGVRLFDGRFAGEDADIFIYYDENSYRVYRAKVVVTRDESDAANQVYNDFESMLRSKYMAERFKDDTNNGYPSIGITVTDNTDSYILGFIDLYRSTNTVYYETNYTVHLDYYDGENLSQHNDNRMDDF